MSKQHPGYTTVSIRKTTLDRLRATFPAIVGANGKIEQLLKIDAEFYDDEVY